MRLGLFAATTALLLGSGTLLAQQQRNPWDDLLAPRQTFPQQQQRPSQPQQQQQLPPQQQRPGGIQTAPLPAPDPALKGQQPPQQQPAQKGRPGGKQLPDVATEQPPQQKIANPTAVFSGLDKITGRIFPFEAAIDETVQFGALQVTPRACYTRPPTEPQNTTGFIEVDEITLEAKVRRIFSGWMFAASPGLNAVEHAIYDVWLVDCKQGPPEAGKQRGS